MSDRGGCVAEHSPIVFLASSKMNKNKKRASPQNEKLMSQLKSIVKVGLREGMSAAGGVAGTYLGNPNGGRKVGKKLAARLSKLVGTGDYASNSSELAMNSLIKPGVNQYATFGDNTSCVRIQHREYVKDIFAGDAGTFSSTSIAVNPGLRASFPYLSGLAQNFEEYRLNGMVFEIVSTTSPYNATSAMGSTIVAMQYNAASSPFTSKAQMENSDFAISARLDKSVMYGIECKDLANNNLFIRSADVSSSVPLTSTDVGLLQIALQTGTGIPSGSVIGELWVSYDIDLMRPHISSYSECGVFNGQLELYESLSTDEYVTAKSGPVVISSRIGSMASDEFTKVGQYGNIYTKTPLMSFTSTPGFVYCVELFGASNTTVDLSYTSSVDSATLLGSYPVTSVDGRLNTQRFYRIDNNDNGKTHVNVKATGMMSANSKFTVIITDCGPAEDFIFADVAT